MVLSYWLFRPFASRKRPISWVVGPQEIASMAFHIAKLIPRSHSAILWRDPFYRFKYNTTIPQSPSRKVSAALGMVLGPIILGRLIARSAGFLYLGELGFLTTSDDAREYEFAFVKSRGCAIACYFVGSDIRSPQLLHDLEAKTGLENLGTHIGRSNPLFDTPEWDQERRDLAAVADEYADLIFSASVDQLSYLKRPTHPVTYFFPDEEFSFDDSKFVEPERIVVLHAPSDPIIKGTERVREAVGRLKSEGYDFEYVELVGVSNDVVRQELRRAQIVLNQFYAFIPGVFGIEALASGCAVLMSSDENIEPDLPPGSNEAWVVTRYYEIYEKLKNLLDNPELMEATARRGRYWAMENVSFSHAGPRLREVLGVVVEP